MTTFQQTTGALFDSLCQRAGLRPIQLRYGANKVMTPTPLVSHDGVQNTSEVTSPLNEGEAFDTYSVSIPQETLQRRIGSKWRDAIAPNQIWYVQRDKREGWIKCRVLGTATTGEGQRWGFKLVVAGLDD